MAGQEVWINAEALLGDWLRRAREGQHSHHEAGKLARTINYWLSVPVIVISTGLGTAAFAAIERNVSGTAKAVFGALSMLAAILTALQTHFGYSQRGEQHKNLGAEYGNIRREIEEILAVPRERRGEPEVVLDRIRTKLDAISKDGYVVGRRTFDQTLKRLSTRDAERQQAGTATKRLP